jgi:opacity protein-like surface antigen
MKYSIGAIAIGMSVICCGLAANQAAAADSGWFLNGDVGPSFVNNMSLTTENLFGPGTTTTRYSFKTGVRADLGWGYQFENGLALGMEAGYLYNSVDLANTGGLVSPDFNQVPVLLDLNYTLPLNFPLKPYLGIGAGVIASGFNGLGGVDGAGQLQAGLKYDVSQRVDLGVGYKLLVTTTHDWSDGLGLESTSGNRTIDQSILASLTLKF